MPHRLSDAAALDLIDIYANSVGLFGPNQADAYLDRIEAAFVLIAKQPGIARLRRELEPPVHAHPYGAHLIIYTEENEGVLILRVRHAREDWQNDLTE